MGHTIAIVLCLVALFGFSTANYCEDIEEINQIIENGVDQELEAYDETLQYYQSVMKKIEDSLTESCDARSMDEQPELLSGADNVLMDFNKNLEDFFHQKQKTTYLLTNITHEFEILQVTYGQNLFCNCDANCPTNSNNNQLISLPWDVNQIAKNISSVFTESVLQILLKSWKSIDTVVKLPCKDDVRTQINKYIYDLVVKMKNPDPFGVIIRELLLDKSEVTKVVRRCKSRGEKEVCVTIEVLPHDYKVTIKVNKGIVSITRMEGDSYEQIFEIIFQKYLQSDNSFTLCKDSDDKVVCAFLLTIPGRSESMLTIIEDDEVVTTRNGTFTIVDIDGLLQEYLAEKEKSEKFTHCKSESGDTICIIIQSKSPNGKHNVTVTVNEKIVSNTIETGTTESIIETLLLQYQKQVNIRCKSKSSTNVCIQIETFNGINTVQVKVDGTVVFTETSTDSVETIFDELFKQFLEPVELDQMELVRRCKTNVFMKVCVSIATVGDTREVTVTVDGDDAEKTTRQGSIDEIFEEKFEQYFRII
jgi:hypothetical protein